MPCCAVLCCAVLCCAVLCCAVLCMLRCSVLYYAELWHVVLCRAVLFYIALRPQLTFPCQIQMLWHSQWLQNASTSGQGVQPVLAWRKQFVNPMAAALLFTAGCLECVLSTAKGSGIQT